MKKLAIGMLAAILSAEALAFDDPIALKLDCAEKGPWTFDVRQTAPEELVHVTEFTDVNRDGHSSGRGEIGKLCANR